MRPLSRYATSTIILLLLSVITAEGSHPSSGKPKRHAVVQSTASGGALARSNSKEYQTPPPPSRVSRILNYIWRREAPLSLKRDPRMGPGPGPYGAIAAKKRARIARRRARAQDMQKRQATSSQSPTSTFGADPPSLSVTAAQPSATENPLDPAWILNDYYAGPSFWNYFSFFTDADPTHGVVNYVNSTFAFSSGLAYTNPKGQIVMKADNTTVLQPGQNRDSVRIQSYKAYTGGLFLLDVERTPYGCGVWPAFWTVNGTWPTYGEIDIYEGVHLSTNNQVTWHTSPGCTLDPAGGFFGVVNTTNCDASVNDNSGCAVTDQSYSSSGETLKNIGGGVFAMKWDTSGISVWFFPRPTVPSDITDQLPDPTGWGIPTAHLSPDDCDIVHHFSQHVIVFNIAFCGDWAGATYLTSGCPGTCNNEIADPSNINESIWIINNLQVYTNAFLQAGELNASPRTRSVVDLMWTLLMAIFLSTLGVIGGNYI